MDRLPVISIIIPAYNAEKTLKKCIKSVLRQTYKNYELIIVDDGSEDNTVAISDFYAERYSAVQVIHSENQGVSSARNLGMEKAIGDYILFLDADDRLIESALDNMVPYTSEAEWQCCSFVQLRGDGSRDINYTYQWKRDRLLMRVLQVVNDMHRAGLETMLMNYYRNINREDIQFDFLTHRAYKSDYDDEIISLLLSS